IEPRVPELDEPGHRALQLREELVDGRELSPSAELAAQEVAEVVDAALRAMRRRQRAAGRASKGAPRVLVARRPQVARPGPRGGQRGDLVVGEQVGGHAAAAVAAGERPARPALPRRAGGARRDLAERLRDLDLETAQLERE